MGKWKERWIEGESEGDGWRCGHVAYYFSPHVFSSVPLQNHTLSQHAQWDRAPQDSRFSLEPRPRPGGGGTFQHHSQSKCHLLLTCKTLTIPPPGAAITNGGEWILMGYAIKKEKERKKRRWREKGILRAVFFIVPSSWLCVLYFLPIFFFGFSRFFLRTKDVKKIGRKRHPLPDFNL